MANRWAATRRHGPERARLGLIADTHDNVQALDRALALFRERGVDCVVHGGDVTTRATVARLKGWNAIVALGNNDTDEDMVHVALRSGVEMSETWEGRLGGLLVAVVHGHNRKRLAEVIGSGRFDLVVTGHTHRLRNEVVGHTRVVNPGALHRAATYNCAIYDTSEDALQVFEVPKTVRGSR